MTRRPHSPSRRTARPLSTAPPPPERADVDIARADDTRPDDARTAPGRAVAPVVAVDRIDTTTTTTLTPDQHAAAVTALAALIHTWPHDTHTPRSTRSRRRSSTTQPGARLSGRPADRHRADQPGADQPGTHHGTAAA